MRSLSEGTWILALLVAGCGSSHPAQDGGLDAGSVRCDSDRECSSAGLVCSVVRGVCVECADDGDCGAGEICVVESCGPPVACTSSRMCPGLVCDEMRGHCVECVRNADCDAPLVCRDARCAPDESCGSDDDCPGARCLASTGACVECLDDGDCFGASCDRSTHTCASCGSDSDCPGGRCDPATEACVECLSASDCEPMMLCEAGACVPLCTCASDADCDDGSFCNGAETCGGCEVGCVAGPPPCASGESCDEATASCGGSSCDRPLPFFRDADSDGFGDLEARMDGCAAPVGYVRAGGDCDDSDSARHPGATELCDGAEDQDCDFAIDEGCSCSGGTRLCGISVGRCARGNQSCVGGIWDACRTSMPAPESCNGMDDDCDGATDESPDVDGACGGGSCVSGACTMVRPVDLALGLSTSYARMSDGTVRQWGGGTLAPVAIDPATLSGVVAMGASRDTFCAILADGRFACMGSCVCWGNGALGVLGEASMANHDTPVAIAGLPLGSQLARSLSGQATCVIRPDGGASCLGWGGQGALGDGLGVSSSTPVMVSTLDDVVVLTGGDEHFCAIQSGGDTWCWGANGGGRLGDGTTMQRLAPVRVLDLP